LWPIVAIEGAQLGQKSGPAKEPAEQSHQGDPPFTRRQFSAEEKIRIVLFGSARRGQYRRAVPPRGDRPEPLISLVKGISGGGKKRLAGDTARAATSDEVKELRREASALNEVVAELTLENRLLKKSAIGAGEDGV